MSKALGVLGGMVAGVVLGVWLSPAPVPETKVIKVEVPKVYTKKVVEEKIVTKDLPKSCKLQLEASDDVQKLGEQLLRLAGEMENRASEIGLDSLYDPQRVVKHHEFLYNKANDMDLVFYDWQIARQSADAYQEECKADIQKSNDGQDVERAEK